jgi:hypothetical protein
MKTKISIALNILLVAVLGVVTYYFYRVVRGAMAVSAMIMLSAADKIDAGKSERVSEIFKEVPIRPTFHDMHSISEKLDAIEPTVPAAPPGSR